MNCVSVSTSRIKEDSTAPEPYDHLCRRRSLPPNKVVAEVGGSVYRHRKFVRRTGSTGHGPRITDSNGSHRKFVCRPEPTLVVCVAGRNGGYIRSNIWTVPSVCNEPVTGSQALGSSQRLERCCLWWAALPSRGIGSAEVTLILLLLLMVDSDDLNVVTLITCNKMIGTSVQSHSRRR